MKFSILRYPILFMSLCLLSVGAYAQSDDTLTKPLDLSKARIVVEGGKRSLVEETATVVLIEEIQKRTGIRLSVSTKAQGTQQHIKLVTSIKSSHPLANTPEAFLLTTHPNGNVMINGADPKGLLNGVGQFLRKLELSKGSII